MITIGLDVGLTGAIAAINPSGVLIGLFDLPVMVHGKTKWIDGLRLVGMVRALQSGSPARLFVERTQPTPKVGVIQANSMGLTLGSTLVALQFARVSIELVSPVVWKRSLGLLMPNASDRDKKQASLDRARMYFPSAPLSRQKDHNKAESLLLCWYGINRNKQEAA